MRRRIGGRGGNPGENADLVFLDVQMPELDGFGVLSALEAIEQTPVIVFVTAHDQFALRAFEVHALDYLLKPSTANASARRCSAQNTRSSASAPERREIELKMTALTAGPGRSRFAIALVIKAGGRVFFLRADEIDWIESAANYVRLHAGREAHLLRETITGLDAKVDPDKFLRINRSIIVNLDRVKELQPRFHGDYVVILQDGTQLTSSRNYREQPPNCWANQSERRTIIPPPDNSIPRILRLVPAQLPVRAIVSRLRRKDASRKRDVSPAFSEREQLSASR